MFYAVIGIPLVVIVLTDWGGCLFDFMQNLWIKSLKRFLLWITTVFHTGKFHKLENLRTRKMVGH